MRKRLKETFAKLLPAEGSVSIYSSFDIIGDIAIIKIPNSSAAKPETIAEAIMARHGNVKAVFVQTSGITGDYRLRSLKHVAGENRTVTVHRESGCCFAVDVESCYFSPRLLHERLRIARLVQPDEVVVNMFAGVGCFSIIIAKHSQAAKVFSIDVNPVTVAFMAENIRRNRVYGKVVPLLSDAKTIIETRLQCCADRVLMPLPEKASAYLPCAVSALKKSGGWIHVHAFEHALKTENPAEKVKQKVAETLAVLNVDFEVSHIRVVRSTGPNWFQLVADVHIK
ncbi:MAG TPA: class I SAM-dependent methyltransferase family protein [Candidatus Bathyarchaeia archaeon]